MTKMLTVLAALMLAAETPTVTGVWQLALNGDHVIPIGMELKQDGEQVTGVIQMPRHTKGQRKDVSLAGRFVDGTLTLAATADESGSEWAALELRATLQADGTLAGKLASANHTSEWTAERLGPRR